MLKKLFYITLVLNFFFYYQSFADDLDDLDRLGDEIEREVEEELKDLDKISEKGKKKIKINGDSCGLEINDKDIKNSVIKNKVVINGKKSNKNCFKDNGSSVNLGISIDKGSKIENSIIKNETIVKDSEITINGKKVIK